MSDLKFIVNNGGLLRCMVNPPDDGSRQKTTEAGAITSYPINFLPGANLRTTDALDLVGGLDGLPDHLRRKLRVVDPETIDADAGIEIINRTSDTKALLFWRLAEQGQERPRPMVLKALDSQIAKRPSL